MMYSVLLVEDNPGDALLVEEALADAPVLGSFRIEHVTRMSAAITALESERFDVILLDLDLPDSSGLATLAVASAHSEGDPIVVLTGSDDELLGLKALQNGAHDYLVKGQVFGTMMARAVMYAIQRHRSDEILRVTEAQHRMLFETMAQGVLYYDAAGNITRANPAALQFFDRSLEDLQGTSGFTSDVVREDGSPFPMEEFPTRLAIASGREKNSTVMGVIGPRDGSCRWLMVHARPHYHPGEARPYQVFTTFTDITRLRSAEAALRTSEERFRTLIEHSHDMTLVIESDGSITYCSPSVRKMLGFEVHEVVGRTVFDFCTPEDRNIAAVSFSQLLEQGDGAIPGVWRAVHRDGSHRRLETFARNLVSHPAVHGVVLNVQDITDRYEAEHRLRAVHERLAAVVETSPLAIIVMDAQSQVQLWNRSAEQMFGWSAEEVVGRPYPLQAPDDGQESVRILSAAVEGKLLEGAELRRCAKDGHVVDINLWNAQLRDTEGNVVGLLGIMADISEQKTLQETLRHAQKMDAVGRLAGGIAHDFNNILTALSGHAGLLLDQIPSADPLRDDVVQIERGVDRAAKLTRQLLTFSRKQVVQPKVIDLCALTSDMEKMLNRILGEDVRLDLNALQKSVCVKADPGQLEQVIVNLAVNARDAMPRGGRLSINVSRVPADRRLTPVAGLPPAAYALLEVTDTGSGMDSEVKAKIFEPFFTTKPQGKGTGLGLPTVYGIVEQAGGWIDVESQPDVGTTFLVYLPYEASRPVAEPTVRRQPISGSGIILLVEDEPAVRQLTERVLTRRGYTVLAAPGGREAAQLAAQHERIDLLITDVIMPQMSGHEVAEMLRKRWPSLEVLYMSGYSEEAISNHGILHEGINFLEKPFTPDQIVAKVAELIPAAAQI